MTSHEIGSWTSGKITSEVRLSVVKTKTIVSYKYRKAFTRKNGVKVRRKEIVKRKIVNLKHKDICLAGDVKLYVQEILILGAHYTDGKNVYVCIRIINIGSPLSTLQNASTVIKGDTFVSPTNVKLITQSYA